MKICCVVVTFNRKDLLIKCLECIKDQTYKPHTVLIVDNASTDGTLDKVKEEGYYNSNKDSINFEYLLLPNNQGGAGGFYNGIKTAHESNEKFDGIWVMDDDGEPDCNCLENLVRYLPQYDHLAPIVLSIEAPAKLAFPYKGTSSPTKIMEEYPEIVPNYCCPFNGILYSRKLVDTIGYPIPELFIWGDEINYTIRAKDAGFIPFTVVNALHKHPSDRVKIVKSLFGNKIFDAPNEWKGYCHWRNTIFNSKGRWSLYEYLRYYTLVSYYLLFIKRRWAMFRVFNEAFFSGFKEKPDDGYRKYMVVN